MCKFVERVVILPCDFPVTCPLSSVSSLLDSLNAHLHEIIGCGFHVGGSLFFLGTPLLEWFERETKGNPTVFGLVLQGNKMERRSLFFFSSHPRDAEIGQAGEMQAEQGMGSLKWTTTSSKDQVSVFIEAR